VAMRFHCLVRTLSRGPHCNTSFFVETVVEIIQFVHHTIYAHIDNGDADRYNRSNAKICCVCSVTFDDIEWLGMSAFQVILQQKQTRYRELLKTLKRKLKQKKPSQVLLEAINPIRSTVFSYILF